MNTSSESVNGSESPWHEGERQLQASVGVVDQMEEIGKKMVRSYLPDQHRQFYEQLPFILAGVVDTDENPWATVIAGKPGFISSPDNTGLNFQTTLSPDDPAVSGFSEGAGIGFLGIELHTRRRNRVNGKLMALSDRNFRVAVDQTMGNCPKYIQHRNLIFERDPEAEIELNPIESTALSEKDIATVRSADSFYVASYVDGDDGKHIDVSHRGGKPGFVKVDNTGELTIPDFSGNTAFNTLGNILLTEKAGLVFVDYETGDVLQMTGSATVVLDSPEIELFGGAERLWTFTPSKIVRRNNALPIRWEFQQFSPNVLDKGSWEKVDHQLKTKAWNSLRVIKIVDESSVIRSFYLEPADGSATIAYMPGQHLPIRVRPEIDANPVVRTYTLSSAPSDLSYRISVKREGLVSTYLHDQVNVDDLIDARSPQGSFTLDPAVSRPAVLLAGGVGVTPMISMVREIVTQGLSNGLVRPVWLFQASRSPQERAFDGEFRELILRSNGAVRRVRAETLETDSKADDSFHPGRIDIELLKSTLPFDDHEFYLCGPPPFMQAMYDALRGVGVRDNRIFAESFGPASLQRNRQDDQPSISLAPAATGSVEVSFSHSDSRAIWKPDEDRTLLELAETKGLEPEYSCRAGNCGTCLTKVISGEVTYKEYPAFEVGDDEALICCAVPAQSDNVEHLKLDL